jgi:hypothetical protein
MEEHQYAVGDGWRNYARHAARNGGAAPAYPCAHSVVAADL